MRTYELSHTSDGTELVLEWLVPEGRLCKSSIS